MKTITNMILIVAALIPASAMGQVCAKQVSVPEYPAVAVAAQWKGVVDLTVAVGARGQVVSVEASGSLPILVDHAKENVKNWVFCIPKNKQNAHVQLRYDYRLEGDRVSPSPPAKVVIDLGAATVVITSHPMEQQY